MIAGQVEISPTVPLRTHDDLARQRRRRGWAGCAASPLAALPVMEGKAALFMGLPASTRGRCACTPASDLGPWRNSAGQIDVNQRQADFWAAGLAQAGWGFAHDHLQGWPHLAGEEMTSADRAGDRRPRRGPRDRW
jgi:hypothetical protein